MNENADHDPSLAKKATARIMAATQQLAFAEEKLEESIQKEIDTVEEKAKKADQAVTSWGKRHPAAYAFIIVVAICIGLVIAGYLCAGYYTNR